MWQSVDVHIVASTGAVLRVALDINVYNRRWQHNLPGPHRLETLQFMQ